MVHPVCRKHGKVLGGSLRRHRVITPIAGEMERRERGFLDLLVRASQFLAVLTQHLQFLLQRRLFRRGRNREIAGIGILCDQAQRLALPSSCDKQWWVGFLDGLWGIVGMSKMIVLASRLRDNSTAHGLDLDQAVLKEESIHPVGDARPRGVASPLDEEYIVHVDGLDAPSCFRKSFEKTVEESAYGVLATPDPIRGDEDGSSSKVHHGCVKVFSTQGLAMVRKDRFWRPFR